MSRLPRTDHADNFAYYWRIAVLTQHAPEGEREHHFHPERDWRFDFAFPTQKVAVEIDGGNRKAEIVNGRAVAVGRHTQSGDYEKLNAATALGWRVFRYTPEMLERDPAGIIEQVLKALRC